MGGISGVALLAVLLPLVSLTSSVNITGSHIHHHHGLDPDQAIPTHDEVPSLTANHYTPPANIVSNITSRRELDSGKPLKVTNLCADTIHPALVTQAGLGPDIHGFELQPGASRVLWVGADWQGRVWGRTNCSFNAEGTGPANRGGLNGGGRACMTGDCNGVLDCRVSGDTPVTLAEFQLMGWNDQSFYDLSLVDGYNVPMGIAVLTTRWGHGSTVDVPPNESNVACVGTASLMAESSYDPYGGGEVETPWVLGTNASHPLPFELEQSLEFVSRWCPWDLLVNPPTRPEDGVYTYPDTDIHRPHFTPCYSACAKYNSPSDCCTGEYGSPSTCKPSSYSKNAKAICPDAYSYAYDDEASTFAVPEGVGFEVVFCPLGRSTNILAAKRSRLLNGVHQKMSMVEGAMVDNSGETDEEHFNKSHLHTRDGKLRNGSTSLFPRPVSFWGLVVAVVYWVGILG
ncbi:MAG: hypothetical protein M1823_000672 [Watsoniomyces obsoletus]|nr:MAG: hypothetical protein M1823_000672 [Watsoniomyces obsoletus]